MPEETVEQIHEKEEKYREFEKENQRYQLIKELANVYTYQYFDGDLSPEKYDNYRSELYTPEKPFRDKKWFQDAQQDAENRNYFHWELEFPKVFFGEQSGFDAVVGNPPYVRQEIITELKDYLEVNYEVYTGRGDLYSYFIERANYVTSDKLGYIVSHKFTKVDSGAPLRKYLVSETTLEEFIDFQDLPVFGENVSAYPAIIILSKKLNAEKFKYAQLRNLVFDNLPEKVNELTKEVPFSSLNQGEWKFISETEKEVRIKLNKQGEDLSDVIGEPLVGVKTGLNEIYIVREKEIEQIIEKENEKELFRPFLKGEEIKRYNRPNPKKFLLFPYEKEDGEFKPISLEDYPGVANYLRENKSALAQRYDIKNSSLKWYELRACDYYDKFEEEKIIYPDISKVANFTIDDGTFVDMTGFILDSDSKLHLSLLNSSLLEWYLSVECAKARGGYLRFKTQYMNNLPLITDEEVPRLEGKVEEILDLKDSLNSINLNISDYMGNYSDGKNLGNLYSPIEGLSDTILTNDATDRDKLKIDDVDFKENDEGLILLASARYKPENEEDFETDQWGYTETELIPAMKFDVGEKMAALIREFVPVAVDEAGGFANFRESATKTKSIIDRLEELTLPKLDDVEDGLEKFIENK
ncbi:MAG: Eco57I restriction-modification methylase domain-containing protein, partial [Candidatus Nanohaloarchaea archaeon]